MTSDLDRTIDTLARWIAESRHLVAFTGAGISTDSGIPDFRGPDGVWTRRDAGLPPPRWKKPSSQVEPNASHMALVTLQEMGILRFVISQNTDDLHRRSGLRPEMLAELHGNGALMRCLGCDARYTRVEVGWDREKWGPGYRTDRPLRGQPPCPNCRGRLISSVVNFGDPLPERDLRTASAHAASCDVMLVLGSSLVVNPAAALVGVAIEAGANVAIINRGETPYDGLVQLRAEVGIAEVFLPAVERVPALVGRKRRRASG
ncbi:SIR2 family NAD-dependent protein deacylase [Polyangium aurulentum]|uniref:SIR2 family NAD-dependent protein deacylase n=1 Tax=Polyangium aurulentum TaxID=2567896 RepID=UPI00146A02B3|nr:Sir2 family NAD-dependent protein deacetylase [Polyangium aurulentum]UQA56004.1 Sir2 family NAD-dependent protein deacetylase [Polyangium aurulentum]